MKIIKHQNAASSIITVTNTATGVYSLINTAGSVTDSTTWFGPKGANALLITPEDGDIRLGFGFTPTDTEGMLLSSGVKYFIPGFDNGLQDVKLIRTGGSNVAVSVEVCKALPGEVGYAVAEQVTLESASITIGTVTGPYSEDVATPATIAGHANMMERDDALSTLTPAAGDWASMRCSAEGALWTQDFNSDDMLTALQLIDDAVYADDDDWTDNTSKHMLVGGLYQSSLQTVTDGDVAPLQVDVNGRLRVNSESAGNAPQAYGIDATGADAYTTVVTAGADRHHMMVSLQGSNDAIVSIDSGTTDHFYIPAGSTHVFDGILIANSATVQGKNATGGSNYTNLAITVW